MNTGESSTGITTASSARTRKASPYDKDFREHVLTPRGITIVDEPSVLVWDHFRTQEPDGNRQEYYRERGSRRSAVWLSADNALCEEIAHEYNCMVEGNLCEAEFASYARETLFRRDRRISPRQYSDLRV